MSHNGRGVLITRPRAEAEALAAELATRGWEPFVEPLLTFIFPPVRLPDLTDIQGLVFTSVQGVTAFAALTTARQWPVYAVGAATAEKAAALGFDKIRAVGRDAADLNRLLAAEPAGGSSVLLHAAGLHGAGDIAAPGRAVRKLIVYEAQAARELSPACRQRLDDGAFTAALFFSPRTAEIFVKLLRQYARTEAVTSIKALCLSDSVVESLRSLPWRDVLAAPTPDKAALLTLLEE